MRLREGHVFAAERQQQSNFKHSVNQNDIDTLKRSSKQFLVPVLKVQLGTLADAGILLSHIPSSNMRRFGASPGAWTAHTLTSGDTKDCVPEEPWGLYID